MLSLFPWRTVLTRLCDNKLHFVCLEISSYKYSGGVPVASGVRALHFACLRAGLLLRHRCSLGGVLPLVSKLVIDSSVGPVGARSVEGHVSARSVEGQLVLGQCPSV